MNTGENEQSLRQAIDLIRKGSVLLLGLHFYFFCYGAFENWGLTAPIVERILARFTQVGIFSNLHVSKLFVLALLALSLVGSRGKKDEKINKGVVAAFLIFGLTLFFVSTLLFHIPLPIDVGTISYIIITTTGFLLTLAGGARLSRLIKLKLRKDIFNEENETFPQEEILRNNEFSVNIPGQYRFGKRVRKMFINIINPFRALLITGVPGSR